MVDLATPMIRRLALLAALALSSPAQSAAEPTSPSQPTAPPPSQGVVVAPVTVQAVSKAESVKRRVDTYVKLITHRNENDETVPRWRSPICPVVTGLTEGHGVYVFNRLSQIATTAGAVMAPTDCQPNLFIVVTSQPDQLLESLRKPSVNIFGDSRPTEINAFISKPRPVRVWYNIVPLDRDGGPILTNDTYNGLPTDMESGGSSRLKSAVVRGFGLIFVLVDGNRIKGVSIGALADYVAMVGLAQIDPDQNLGDAPTILRLFTASAADAPPGLSDWDQAFLYALYHTDATSKLQRSRIASDAASQVTAGH